MFDLIERFYESATGTLASQMYEAGQFFEAPALHLIERYPMPVLQGRYRETTLDYEYSLENADREYFREQHEPVATLGLRRNERAAVVPCKLRPVVIASLPVSTWKDGRRQSAECYVVVPVHSFKGDEFKEEFSPLMIERIRSYAYVQFFYLPANERPYLAEGFLRFVNVNAEWPTLMVGNGPP